MQLLKDYPHTYESDFSTYDATNGHFHRTAVDRTFFELMYLRGVLKEPDVCDYLENQDDRYLSSNTESIFASEITAKGHKGPVYKAKGKLIGTTYSGHPTCTTLCGTLRNLLYHLFVIHQYGGFSFDAAVAGLPLHNYQDDTGAIQQRPLFYTWMDLLR